MNQDVHQAERAGCEVMEVDVRFPKTFKDRGLASHAPAPITHSKLTEPGVVSLGHICAGIAERNRGRKALLVWQLAKKLMSVAVPGHEAGNAIPVALLCRGWQSVVLVEQMGWHGMSSGSQPESSQRQLLAGGAMSWKQHTCSCP